MRIIDELRNTRIEPLQIGIISVPIAVAFLFLMFPRFFFPDFDDYQFFFKRTLIRNGPLVFIFPFGFLAGISVFWKNKKTIIYAAVLLTLSHFIVIYHVWLSGNVRETGVWNNFMAFLELVVILPLCLLLGFFASKYFTGAPNRSLN